MRNFEIMENFLLELPMVCEYSHDRAKHLLYVIVWNDMIELMNK